MEKNQEIRSRFQKHNPVTLSLTKGSATKHRRGRQRRLRQKFNLVGTPENWKSHLYPPNTIFVSRLPSRRFWKERTLTRMESIWKSNSRCYSSSFDSLDVLSNSGVFVFSGTSGSNTIRNFTREHVLISSKFKFDRLAWLKVLHALHKKRTLTLIIVRYKYYL